MVPGKIPSADEPRKLAEALRVELQHSEERHRTIIESLPAFVAALDAQGKIVLWNRRLEEITGFTRQEMLGRDGAALLGEIHTDTHLPLKSGGFRLVRWRHAQMSNGTSGDPELFAVGVDVTEERQMQRRAAQAERLAAVGTLAAGLAHEVRNPLNSASLQLQVLERRLGRGETGPEALKSAIEVVQNEIRRLDRLVNEFLAFARPAPLDLHAFSLNDLVTSVLHLVKPECDPIGILVRTELDPELGSITADEERIRQVLLNVVRNGMEAMETGGTLTLRTHRADPRGFVRLEVEDTGPGFPEDAPIFDAFYTTKENGTGLGLSIVHSIISDHGGSIHVDSRKGRTCVAISLPQLAP